MKQALSIFMLLIIVASCTDTIGDSLELSDQQGVLTKRDNHVSYCDIAKLNNVPAERSRNASDSTSAIECIVDANGDTLLYVYKDPEGGWTIYPSDSRVPPIVATSEEGSYENTKQNDGARLWIQSIAEDIALIKQLDDSQLNFTPEEIESNRDFWESISNSNEFAQSQICRNNSRTQTVDRIPDGEYVYRTTTTEIQKYDSIGSILKTLWHQDNPYNKFCPSTTYNQLIKAPAGCVAIAGAQMLYFCHYHFGVPETAPSFAYCSGNVQSYQMDQSEYSSTIWDSMIGDPENTAPLIANVGKLVGMMYGDNVSLAILEDLPTKVFAKYGISCMHSYYNAGKLSESLLAGMPVILRAASKIPGGYGNVGHAFIADRYKRVRYKTTTIYEWEYNHMAHPVIVPYVPPRVEYSYSSPFINMIGINWGWKEDYVDPNEWYSITGDWINHRYSSAYNWNISREMITDFKVLQ